MSYKKINLFDLPPEKIINDAFLEARKISSLDIEFPIAVRLLENPKFSLFDRNLLIFPGAVDGTLHDYIHILLGRSFLPLDEAFVVGFCMGSTGKMRNFHISAFTKLAETIYPKQYRFSEIESQIFRTAVNAGNRFSNTDLSKIPRSEIGNLSIENAREKYLSDWSKILYFYKEEALLTPDETSSQRILNYLS